MSSVAQEGVVTVEMTPTPDMAGESGLVRAGTISGLAESAMARCAGRATIFDLKLNFISAARIGETLRATGHVIHAGRRTVVTECRIEGPQGSVVATASGTFAVRREKE